MTSAATRVVVWNCFRREPGSPEQVALRDQIAALDPDIVFLTETDTGMLPMAEVAAYPHWNRRRTTERTVIVFSKSGLIAADSIPAVATRMAAGTATTATGPVDCVGVCVPYDGARHRKHEPLPRWQAHLDFLQNLGAFMSSRDSDRPLILAGDFNQTVPRSRAPRLVFEALTTAIGPALNCVTKDLRNERARALIDHVFVSSHFSVQKIQLLPGMSPEGRRLSDHDGIAVDFLLDPERY